MLIDRKYDGYALHQGMKRRGVRFLSYAEVVRHEKTEEWGNGTVYIASPYCMVVIPCTLSEQDVPGFVPVEYFKQQPSLGRKDKSQARILLAEDDVIFPQVADVDWFRGMRGMGEKMDEEIQVPHRDEGYALARFPTGDSWRIPIAPMVRNYIADGFTAVGEGLATGFNAEYLSLLQRSMASDRVFVTRMSMYGPLLVETEATRGDPIPPYAILMPIADPIHHQRARRPVLVNVERSVEVPNDSDDVVLRGIRNRLERDRGYIQSLRSALHFMLYDTTHDEKADERVGKDRRKRIAAVKAEVDEASLHIEQAYKQTNDPIFLPLLPDPPLDTSGTA